MNYWKKFAEMLGLELEQEFVITDDNGEKQDSNTYKISEYGVSVKTPKVICELSRMPAIFTSVLDGNYKVVPIPWKPKDGEAYWKWDTYVEMAQFKLWNGSSMDFACWKLGNCFETSEEAQSKGKGIMEQIKKEFEEA